MGEGIVSNAVSWLPAVGQIDQAEVGMKIHEVIS